MQTTLAFFQQTAGPLAGFEKESIIGVLIAGITVIWRAYQASLAREQASGDKLVETIHVMRIKADALDSMKTAFENRLEAIEDGLRECSTCSGRREPRADTPRS